MANKMLHIITDSASDLPKQVIDRFHVHVIPTPVVIDGTDYFDGKTIFTTEFYKILDDLKRDVRTYHINPTMFEEAFLPYAKAGDSVIYICFSTGIAGTYNAANLAKTTILETYPEFDLTIFDSRCASIGFGLLVYKLLCLKEQGAGKETLLRAAEYYRAHIRHIFTVRTLTYLVKGGRVSKLKGAVGETLDMKPVLTVDEKGALVVLTTVRGRKKSLRALAEYAVKHAVAPERQTVALCHGEDEEALQYMSELSDEMLHPKDKLVTTVGCAIGAHVGRGIVGLCFLDAEDSFEDRKNWE